MCCLPDIWHSPINVTGFSRERCWQTPSFVPLPPSAPLRLTSFPFSPLCMSILNSLSLQQEYNVRLLYTHSERCQRIMTKVVGGSTASRDRFSRPGCQEEGDLASNGFATAKRGKLPPKPAGHCAKYTALPCVPGAGAAAATWKSTYWMRGIHGAFRGESRGHPHPSSQFHSRDPFLECPSSWVFRPHWFCPGRKCSYEEFRAAQKCFKEGRK